MENENSKLIHNGVFVYLFLRAYLVISKFLDIFAEHAPAKEQK